MNRNVLLVSPTLITETPITLAMLAPILKEKGFAVKTAVNTFKKPLTIQDFIEQAKGCDIIGISMLTFDILFVYDLIRAFKEVGKFVMVGGPHATDLPRECIEVGADIVVVGEGEDVLRDICDEYPNITKGIRNRKPPVDLAKQAMPDLTIFDHDLFRGDDGLIKGFHRIYTTRGCPGKCTFCDWQVFKQSLRAYPVDEIIKDIQERVDKYSIRSFSIADDCFTINHKRVYEFCKKIAKIRPKIKWRANSRANLVNKDLLQAMKESGCHSIAFGLESGDEETLKKINKMVLLKHNIKAPWLAHEAGLEVYGCLMTGFPWETTKHVQSQLDFIKETWDAVSLFQVSGSLMPFPGTDIYREYHKEYGFTKYWLNPDYQKLGIQVYQNAVNPLAVSTFYQRYFFDDTYIQDELFFRYTDAYKTKVKEMVLEIGRHNLKFMIENPFKRYIYSNIAKMSLSLYNHFPNLEKKIGGMLYKQKKRSAVERLRDRRRGISGKR